MEREIINLNIKILSILLRDKTTRKNIIWATDDYAVLGDGYYSWNEITVDAIKGTSDRAIKSRSQKSKQEQSARSKDKAEVFTPSWVCNKQNNLIDNEWFNSDNVFNIESDFGWTTNDKKIVFPNIEGKTWRDYVKVNRLEISCGEAPYLVSRYDTVSGEIIPVKNRIGLLDRKLRVISENVDSNLEWLTWATKAVQSIYGYDWQGDNVFLARENIVCSVIEHYKAKFDESISEKYLAKIAKVVAWNIWQMDGIKFVVPNSCHEKVEGQLNLLGEVVTEACPGCVRNEHGLHTGKYCRIYDWSRNGSVEFYSLVKKGVK